MNNVMNITKLSYTNLWSMRKMLVSILIFIPISALNLFILNMIIPITVYNFTYQVMAYEDKDSIDTLISYLPVTKKEYILSRYVLAFINLLIGITFFTLGYIFILMVKNTLLSLAYKLILWTLDFKQHIFNKAY
ncbi:ABC-2 transporter permease [Metaclostridioides mangenotii]|uniref:ABC-2 transporter permease n=1 Tax=Metaclostridioides mangenotii TaxID=1540 RepID=UPI000463DED5|nr:ABC-2 transporter permease [Clostridioides mangenotii]